MEATCGDGVLSNPFLLDGRAVDFDGIHETCDNGIQNGTPGNSCSSGCQILGGFSSSGGIPGGTNSGPAGDVSGFIGGANAGDNTGANSGDNSGFTSGANAGFTSGTNTGANAGANSGNNSGINSGFISGYDAGYNAGTSAIDLSTLISAGANAGAAAGVNAGGIVAGGFGAAGDEDGTNGSLTASALSRPPAGNAGPGAIVAVAAGAAAGFAWVRRRHMLRSEL